MCCCAQINGTAGPSLEMKGHCLCVGVGVGVVVGVDALPGLWLDKHALLEHPPLQGTLPQTPGRAGNA